MTHRKHPHKFIKDIKKTAGKAALSKWRVKAALTLFLVVLFFAFGAVSSNVQAQGGWTELYQRVAQKVGASAPWLSSVLPTTTNKAVNGANADRGSAGLPASFKAAATAYQAGGCPNGKAIIWHVDEDSSNFPRHLHLWSFADYENPATTSTDYGVIKYLDPATNTIKTINDAGDMESMAVNPNTGQAYFMSAGRASGGPSGAQALWTYDLDNAASNVGNIVFTLLGHITRPSGRAMEALAFDLTSGRLYTADPVDSSQNNSTVTDTLRYIDLSALNANVFSATSSVLVGTIQGLGHTNNYVDGMEFDENGNLFMVDGTDQHLYRVNKNTAAITVVEDTNVVGGIGSGIDLDIETIAWDARNNRLIATSNDESDPEDRVYVEITLGSNGANILRGHWGAGPGILSTTSDGADFESSAMYCPSPPPADLSITKTDGVTTYTPGGTSTYTIVVRNNGPTAVTGAVVSDAKPSQITSWTWACSGATGGASGCNGVTGSTANFSDTVDLPVNATITYTVTANIASTAGGSLANTACVAAPSNITDSNPSNNCATDTDTADPRADLGITKTDGTNSYTPGGALTYTVTVINNGPSAVTNAVVSDTKPAQISTWTWACAGSTGGASGCTPAASGSSNFSDTVNLPVGATITYTVTANISAGATGNLANTACIAPPSGVTDSVSTNDCATDTDTPIPQADLSISKTDGVTTYTPGGTLTYTVVVTNNGPSNVTNAVVTDAKPAQISTWAWACAGATGGASGCTAAASSSNNFSDTVTLPAGATITYTVTAQTAAGATGDLVNTACVDTPVGVTDPVSGNDCATDTDTPAPVADLSVSKTDGVATYTPGGTLTYNITVFNNGPSNVTGALFTDNKPSQITQWTWSCSGSTGGASGCDGATGSTANFTDTINLPAGSTLTYTVTAQVAASATGSLTNQACIAVPSGTTDSNSANNCAGDTDTADPRVDLAITKTDGSVTYTPGGSLTYTVVVTNNGPSNVNNASVTDAKPAQITSWAWACAGSTGGATGCTPAASGTANFSDFVNLPAGASITYTVTAQVGAGASGNLVNTACVAAPSGTTETNSANNCATDTDTPTAINTDLAITKTDGVLTYTPGGTLTYTVVVSNNGPNAVTNAVVTDTKPAQIVTWAWACAGATGGATGCTPAAAGTANFSDTIDLPVGATISYTVTAQTAPSATGSLANTACVDVPAGVNDTNSTNNCQTDTDTPDRRADLAITKTDGVTSYTPGGTLTYTIVVTNNGPSNVTNAMVTDTKPAQIASWTWTCAAAAGGATGCTGITGSTANFSDAVNLPAGATITYSVTVQIAPGATGNLVNTACVAPPTGVTDPTSANDCATDTDTPAPVADLAITKTDGTTTYTPGGTLTYTVVVTNNGPSNVTNAAVSDTKPAQISTWAWACAGATGGATGCTAAASSSANFSDTVNLPVGATITYTVTAQVASGATGNLANTACVAPPAGTTDNNNTNDCQTDTDTPTPQADLSITKTDGSATYTPGGTLTYTIVVTNNGLSDATNAVVSDTRPTQILNWAWTCGAATGGASGCTSAASGTANFSDTVTLPAGATLSYTVTANVRPTATGDLINTACVAPPTGVTDNNSANDCATDTDTPDPRADLAISKTDGVTTYTPGGTLTYTVVVTNNGPSNVSGASVTDTKPAQITSWTWVCTNATTGATGCTGVTGSTANFSDSVNLQSGASITYTVTAQVAAGATGNLANTACVAPPAGVTDPISANDCATDTDTPVPVANLAISKDDGTTSYTPGGTLIYTVTVTNNGPSNVTNAAITDAKPAQIATWAWACGAATGGATGCTAAASGTANFSDTINLPAGATQTYIVTAQVAANATGNLANTACVAPPAGTTDNNNADDCETDTDTPMPVVDLAITKTDGVLSYTPGGTLTYTIVVTNNGPSNVTNAAVTDTKPAQISTWTWTCGASTGGASGCTGAASGSANFSDTIDLPAGATQTYTVTAQLSAAATGNLANTACIAPPAGTSDTNNANDCQTDTDTPDPRADLAITKTDGSATYTPGGTLTYTIVVTNNGPSNVTGAIVADTKPAQISSWAWACGAATGGATGCTAAASGTANFSDTINLPAGATQTYTVTAQIAASATGNLVNTACVDTPVGVTDTVSGNDCATDTDTPAPMVDLSVSKTDGVATYTPGGTLTYTVTVFNNGPSDAVGAVLSDGKPAQITNWTWTCAAAGGGATGCDGVTDSTANFSDTINLPAGATITYSVTVQIAPNATGNLVNTACVAPPTGVTDTNNTNDCATDTDTRAPIADLAITKTDGTAIYTPGGTLTYTVVVTNNGPSNVNGVVVTDTKPSQITSWAWACAASTGGATGCTPAASGTANFSDTINLPVGASITYTVTANVDIAASGNLVNTACVAPPVGTTDNNNTNDCATDTDTVTAVNTDLAITKTDGTATYTPGGTLTYTIVVTNNGPNAVVGAVIADTRPTQILNWAWVCGAATGGAAGCTPAASGTASFSDTIDLPVGATQSYIVTANVRSSATGDLSNTACVAVPAGFNDTNNTNDCATDTDTATPMADLAITKTDGVTSYTPGGTLTYTVVVTNNGPSNVTGARVSDARPSQISTWTWTCASVTGGATGCNGITNSAANFADLINLPAGATMTYTVTAQIAASATGDLANTACIAPPTGTTDTNNTNDCATDTDTAAPMLDLAITKTDGVTSYTPGGTLTYTIVVSNNGPSNAVNAAVSDARPTQITSWAWTCGAATGGASGCTAAASSANNFSDTINLPAGATQTYTVTAQLASGATGNLTNTVCVAPPAGATDTNNTNDCAGDTDTPVPVADLSITKTDNSATYAPGGVVTYTIVVANNGPSNVAGATVNDAKPAQVTLWTWTCGAATGGAAGCTGITDSTTNFSDTIDLPAGATQTYTVTARTTASATGNLVNTACVGAPAGVTDNNSANDCATDTDTPAPVADLAVSKTDGVTTYTPGGTLTYTVVVTNNGPSNVTGAVFTDNKPAQISTWAWTCTAVTGGATGCTSSPSGSANFSDTVNLPALATITYTVTANVPMNATGNLANTACVAPPAGVTDNNNANDCATDTDTPVPMGDLAITKTDGVTTYTPGGTLTYTIVVSNRGPSDFLNASVTDVKPPQVASWTWTCGATTGGATGCTGVTGSTGDFSDTLNLPGGSSVTYIVTALIESDATGDLANTACAAPPTGGVDSDTSNNCATDTDTPTPRADLAITKNDGTATYTAGGTLTYTVTVTNNGPSDANGATVSDTRPTQITNWAWACGSVTGGASGCTPRATTTANFTDTVNLPAGASITYTVTANVRSSATGDLVNTACVAAPAGVTDANNANDCATDTDTPAPQADLAITKDDGVTIYTPGGALTYTVTVTNNGPSNVTGAVVTDARPAQIASWTWTCTAVSTGATGCNGVTNSAANFSDTVNLQSGASITYTVTAQTAPGATGNLANTACVAPPAGTTDTNNTNDCATDTDTPDPRVDLGVTKTDNTTVYIPGGTLTYTIVVTNNGPSSALGATVTDAKPAQIANWTWSCTSLTGGAAGCNGVTNSTANFSDTVDVPPGGSITYTVTAQIAPGAAGNLINTVCVAPPTGTTDTNTANDCATDTDTRDAQVDLAVTKTDGTAIYTPGGTLTYTIVVSNNGPGNVTGAIVADTKPAQITSWTWTCGAATGGATGCTPAASSANNFGDTIDLPAGATQTYTVTANVSSAAGGDLTNTACVDTPVGVTDTNNANDCATDIDTVTAVNTDLSITKTDGVLTYTPGGVLTYTVVVTNNGPNPANGAVINDTKPAQITSWTWTCGAATGGATGCTPAAAGAANFSDTVNLPVNSSITYTVTAQTAAGATGNLDNTACVVAPTGVNDTNSSNNCQTDSDTPTPRADLAITKTDGSATYLVGGVVTYTIVVSNNGPSDANNAAVSDTKPAQITSWTWTCAGATGGASGCTGVTGSTANFTDTVNLPAGATITYTVTAQISSAATGNLVNTACVAPPAGTTDPTSGNDCSTDTDTPDRVTDLSITKTDGVTTYTAGGALTYTIVVTNNGTADVTNAVVTDTKPAQITSWTWTCGAATGGATGCTPAASGSANFSDSIDLPRGATQTYTVTAQVAASATGNLVNTVCVAPPAGVIDPNSANDCATDADTPAPRADLAVTKTDGTTTYTAGGTLTYTVVVTNNGPSNVTGAIVNDAKPAQISSWAWTCGAATGGATGCTPAASSSANFSDTIDLPAGATQSYTVTAQVAASATGDLANTACVAPPAGVTDPTNTNDCQTDTDTANPQADLSITKTDGTAVYVPGGTLTYTIVVTNNGPSAVMGATVNDTRPTQIATWAWTCAGATGGASGCTPAAGSAANFSDMVDLPVGATITYTVTANVSPSATGNLANTACVATPAGITDLVSGNNCQTDTDTRDAVADLAITKTDGVSTYTPGGTVTYTVVVTNNGPGNVAGAIVTDIKPAQISSWAWTCGAATGGATGCTPAASGSANFSDTIDLPAGAAQSYTVTAQIAASATGDLVNTACVALPAGVNDNNTANNCQTDTDTPAPQADLAITKTDGTTTYTAGGTLTYTIVVTNNGLSNVTGASVTDTKPAQITSWTWTCGAATGGATGCTAAASSANNFSDTIDLPAGATQTYTVTAQIAASATGNLINTACVAAPAGTTDGNAANNCATDTDTGDSRADLAITKTDGTATYTAGGTLTYTVAVTNNGPSNVTGAVVTDTRPTQISSWTWTCAGSTGGATGCTPQAAGTANFSDTVNLPVGATITYTVTANVQASATGNLANTACVAPPTGVTDSSNGNDCATDTDTPAPQADLSITKTDGSATYTPGGTLTYTVVVTNNGPSNVTGAVVTDNKPAQITSWTWTCTAVSAGASGCNGVTGSAANFSDTVNLQTGATITYTVTAQTASGATGNLANTACVAPPAGTTDPVSGNDCQTDTDTPDPRADLAITKTDGSATYSPGGTVVYTVVVSNNGPSNVTGAAISDAIPAQVSTWTWACSAATGGATGCTAAPASNANFNDTVDLPAGATITYTVTAQIAASATGNLVNQACVDTPVGVTDANAANDCATDTDTPAPQADLSVTKTDGSATYTPGGTVTYTVVLTNNGPANVIGAVLTDNKPTRISQWTWTCAGATGGATGCDGAAASTANFTDTVDLPAGATITYTVTAQVLSNATGNLVNQACVAAPAGVTDPNSTNNCQTDTDTPNPQADLSITKTDGSATYTPGGVLTYTVVVTNNGPSNATNSVVTDNKPAQITSWTWVCSNTSGGATGCNGVTNSAANFTDTVTLPAGATITYTVTAQVAASATGSLANTACVAPPASVTDPNTGNDCQTDTDTPVPVADLAITKTDGAVTYTPGGTLTYTVVVTNNGPSNVAGAMVTDNKPAQITAWAWACTGATGGATGCTPAASSAANFSDAVDLPAGATITYTVTANVDNAAVGNLVNTACVTAPGGTTDNNNTNDCATDTDTPTAINTDLAITKTDGSATYTPGGIVTYTVVVTNNGPNAVTGAVVTDNRPAQIATWAWACTGATGGATGCTPAASSAANFSDSVDLPANSSITYTVTAQTAAGATGSLANTACVVAPIGVNDTNNTNDCQTDTDTPDGRADLAITKTDGSATYTPGGVLTYTIVVTNNGPSNVTGATISDNKPAQISQWTWSCAGATGGASGCNGVVDGTTNFTDTVNLPAGATITYTVTAQVSAAATGNLANTACVAPPAGTTDPTSANDCQTDTDTPQGQADLSITKTDNSATYTAGGTLTYTVVVTNRGPSDVIGAILTDNKPAQISQWTWTCGAVTGGATGCDGVTNSTANFTDTVNLPTNATITYTVTAQVSAAAAGNLANTACVAPPGGITDPVNNNDCQTDTDTPDPRADLAITKTDGSATYTPGGTLTYTVVVTNNGPSNVTGATVTDNKPAQITSWTWTCGAATGGASGCDGVTGSTANFTDTVTMPAGATITYTVTAQVASSAAGNLANTACVAPPAGTTDPTASNDCQTDTDTPTPRADLAITKTDGVPTYTPGGNLTYTIVVTNNGPSDVVGAIITDAKPALITQWSWSCAGATGGATGCNGAAGGTADFSDTVNIPSGGSITYSVTATVSPAATGSLVNTACVAAPAGTTDPVTANDCATDTDTGDGVFDLSITKTDNSATYTPGGTVTYTVVVTNNGPSNAAGVIVTDNKPAQITSWTWTCAGATGGATGCTAAASSANNFTDTVDLPAGATITYTVTAPVASSATGNLLNTACVAPSLAGSDPNPANDCATDTDTPTPRADLAITKTDGSATYTRGGTLTYTIVVTNNGPSDAVNAVVTDNKPSRISRWTWACTGTTAGATGCDGVTDSTANFTDTVDLPAGATITYTVTALVTATATGNLVNTACVAPPVGTTDPTASNDCATDTDQPLIITIAKTAAAPVQTAPNSFQMVYTLTVSNTGAVAGTYNLDDEFQFGTGVTVVGTPAVTYAAASTDTLGTTINAAFSGAASNTRIVTNETLGVGLTDVFTVTVNISVDAATATSTSLNCTLNAGETGTGARNTATLSGNATGTATACQALPRITIAKTASTPTGTSPLGSYRITYTLTVSNTGAAAGGYNLDDVFEFGEGLTVIGAPTVTYSASSSDALDTAINAAFTGAAPNTRIVSGESIVNGGTDIFQVVVNVQATLPTATAESINCTLTGAETGTGLRNTASLSGNATGTATACQALPVFTLGNRVWHDLDNDGFLGIEDGPSPGMDGVVINLYADLNGDNAPDGAVLQTVTTAGGGYYYFHNLVPGRYIVEVAPSNFVLGARLHGFVSSPNDGSDPDSDISDDDDNGRGMTPSGINGIRSAAVNLGSASNEPTADNDPDTNPLAGEAQNNRSNRTVDFGFVRVYTLGNRIWRDTDLSGTLNGSEAGINGVTVRLLNGMGTAVATDITGAPVPDKVTSGGGYYRYDNLPAGDYIVEVVAANFTGSGILVAHVSSAGGNDPDTDVDDGDDNGLGVTPDAVTGIRSAPVTLGEGDGTSEPGNDNDPTTNPATVEAPNNQSNRTVDFGFARTYTLGNRVWKDLDNSGTINAADGATPGIDGVVVRLLSSPALTQATDAGGTTVPDQTTAGGGYYSFSNVPAGDYVVQVLASNFNGGGMLVGCVTGTGAPGVVGGTGPNEPAPDPDNNVDGDDNGVTAAGGAVQSLPITLGEGTGIAEPTNDNDPTTNPQPGEGPNNQSNRTLDFGFTTLMTVGNLVWKDLDSDGIRDTVAPNEPGIANVKVVLYADTNNNGAFNPTADQMAAMTNTNSSGAYSFANVLPGNYFLVVDGGNFVAGGALLGCVSTSGNVTGNSDQDNNDHGVDNPTPAAGGIASTLLTLLGNGEPVDDGDGANGNQTIDFGFTSGSLLLGNSVWKDTNRNGARETGEPGIGGVKINLYRDVNGNGRFDDATVDTLQASTTSASNGGYQFQGLTGGDYFVQIDAINFAVNGPLYNCPGSPGQAAGNSDLDGRDHGSDSSNPLINPPITTVITLTAGGEPVNDGDGADSNQTIDFGFINPIELTVDDANACIGNGSVLAYSAVVFNASATAQQNNPGPEFTANLPAGLVGVAGSCTVTGGTTASCTVSGSQVVWNGSIPAGASVTINFQVQVANNVIGGAQLCVAYAANFDGDNNGANEGSFSGTLCRTVNCPPVGPGEPLPGCSVLIFPVYTSNSSTPNTQNTRISLTNLNPSKPAAVHLFFVDGASCSVSDAQLCLTQNQTTSFLASDFDPDVTGYLIAVAVDPVTGCPIPFNYLAGDEHVKFSSGHQANLKADCVPALAGAPATCNAQSVTAQLNFDNVSYAALPRVLGVSNLPSRADDNDTMLIVNRIGGNLGTGADTIGSLFGLLFNDEEAGYSFTLNAGSCQYRASLSNTTLRTAPRFDQVIPAGRSGWLKIYSQTAGVALTGAAINRNPSTTTSANAFNQGHNLHSLTQDTGARLIVPVFPSICR